MRLHTDKIDATHIHEATLNLPGVRAQWTMHGSRSHDRAFEVRLTGNGGTNPNDSTVNSATWDEWGAFIAALYVIDPDAMWGSNKRPVYRDSADFHYQTATRFADEPGTLPADTHKRHNWNHGYGVATCTKCSAERYHRY